MQWTETKKISIPIPIPNAATPLTLNEIYAIAQSEWLIKRQNVSV